MPKAHSIMLPLGTPAPHFTLNDVISGKQVELNRPHDAKATVIMFICNHCPYVKHVSKQLTILANDYLPKGVRFLAINANDVDKYPDDSPENMKRMAVQENYPFPYLFDETQEVAKAYQAVCTPDFFIFDKDHLLAYRGQLDDSKPGNDVAVTGASIRHALDCLLANQAVSGEQKPSMGCTIKWKE